MGAGIVRGSKGGGGAGVALKWCRNGAMVVQEWCEAAIFQDKAIKLAETIILCSLLLYVVAFLISQTRRKH